MSKNEQKSNSENSNKKKVLVFVVCYNAAESIEPVLDRIPQSVWDNPRYETDVLIIDDESSDMTFEKANAYSQLHPHRKLTVLYNPKNQGYGGNQKIGYFYAIKERFDVVVLLHGDGQYAPEYLEQMIEPLLNNQADAVFGSRMLRKADALKGGMPFYKWIGNQILTFLENRIIKSSLSEFHSGYRAYSVAALKSVPFEYNCNYFDFDTDIIVQFVDTAKRIKEIPIPTFYGDEICRVNGIKYAFRIIGSCLRSRMVKMGIYYHPKFDYESESGAQYQTKFGYPSSQQYAFDRIKPGSTVLDVGCGPGFMAERLSDKQVNTISIDRDINEKTKEHSARTLEIDLEKYDFGDDFGKVDFITLLDVIEHMKSPERLLKVLRKRFCSDAPEVIITTGNIAFFPLRIGLLFNRFGYGKRGILDLDHSRLFTFSSLLQTLEMNSYEIVEKKGIPVPFPLAVGDGWPARILLKINRFLILCSRSLFSYQIAVIARPLPTLECLLDHAHQGQEQKLNAIDPQKG